MSDTQPTVSTGALFNTRLLRDPSTLILLAGNLLPLAGVLFWGWDAFVLLVLYWFETAIIGFWMLVRIATASPGSLGFTDGDGSPTSTSSPIGLTLFFIVHAGIFMGVHFVFLWSLFAGDWAGKIHGPVSFVHRLVIETGLWLPLLVLFFTRGIVFFHAQISARLLAWLNRRQDRAKSPPAAKPPTERAGSVIGSFYARVVTMHIAILAGGFLSFLGTLAPLIILIALKTVVDLGVHLIFDFGDANKTFKALLSAREQAVRQRMKS